MEWFFVILLIIHIIVCLIIYFLVDFGVLKVSKQMLPIAFFVPVWGLAAIFTCNYLSRKRKAGSKGTELEELMFSSGNFRRIIYDDEKATETVVPLEEAIRINDTKVRRKLMMDIMREDPAEFVELLQQARLNDDIEVTHYASTAMMEVQRKYEVTLQKYEKEMQTYPDNIDMLNAYLRLLKRYIDSGMLKKNMLIIQRTRYDTLLKKKIAEYPAEKQPYFNSADNLIELGYFEEAEKTISFLTYKWPNDEKVWIIKLKLYFEWRNKPRFNETIFKIKQKNIYFSPQYRDLLSFWKAG